MNCPPETADRQKVNTILRSCEQYQTEEQSPTTAVRDADLYFAIENFRADRLNEHARVIDSISLFPPSLQKTHFNNNTTIDASEKQGYLAFAMRVRREKRDPS